MSKRKHKAPVSRRIKVNEAYMKEHLGIGVSFDLGFRKLTLLKKDVYIYYLTGLTETPIIVELLEQLVRINDDERQSQKLDDIIQNRLVHQQVNAVDTMDEAVDQLLSGLIVVFIDGFTKGYVIDVRSYPGRTPEEPDTERVIRGSRDGYTENVVINTALTRRRIRDERLRNEMLKVGERSKTDVCVAYLQDVADKGLIDLVKSKINEIEIDGISMAEKSLEEFIVKRGIIPYPMVRFTERPDVAATHLLEGHVVILVDTSPSAIIVPATFFHHMQHAEEFHQSPVIGTVIRWLRFCAVLMSIFLLPLWLLFVMDPTLLPKALSFIGPNEEGNIPISIQIIMGMAGIEFLRMAAIHTPTPLSTAMGLIAAVLIGQIAIDVGMFSPEVILYVSLSAIGGYVTPSYELSVANKLANVFLVIVTALFGLKGFLIGVLVYTLWLVRLSALNTPYLWPFIPFNFKAMMQIIIRVPVPFSNKRPSIVHPENNYRQPVK
ncbi:spore germination protein [Lentibacillus sp. JNUCC-1]|uniref:spore germination protein n=1 Tax=Lentibacillus sp. JNUCC-1 TaxID=2654513 RepID=UPI0012E912E2|nr:spore germination protein [Lentibacillus sp. JNUCC-1]